MAREKKLRVAIVAPPFGNNGGPEVVTQNLTNALLELGVDVTLFAPGDWKTKAKHIHTLPKSLWNMKNFNKQDAVTRRNLIISSQIGVLNHQKDFDLIHLHSQRYAYVVAKNSNIPCVLSFHNVIKKSLFSQIKEAGIYTVALSKYQRGRFKTDAIIRNGVPIKKIDFSFTSSDYIVAIGRIADQKGIDTAIEIAKAAKKKLLIFGRTGNSPERQDYFNHKIKPHLDNNQIIYKDQIPQTALFDYLKKAQALLFTIKRPEVCPMTIAEALACGVPIVGTKIDPLPELLVNKKVSFLSNNLSELISTIKNSASLFNRKECRRYAEKEFDSLVMAKKYLKLYRKILKLK